MKVFEIGAVLLGLSAPFAYLTHYVQGLTLKNLVERTVSGNVVVDPE